MVNLIIIDIINKMVVILFFYLFINHNLYLKKVIYFYFY